MKYHTTIIDICVVVLLGVLHPFSPLIHQREAIRIGDKVIVSIHQRPSDDSLRHALLLANQEIEEIQYYRRNHDVADEGYNLIASHHTKLQQYRQYLKGLLKTNFVSYYTYDTIPARQRHLVAYKTDEGYWYAGHFFTHYPFSGRGITIDQ